MRQTYMAKPSTVEKKWYLIDAKDQTLGRLSSEVASILRGKHKPTYTPHIDTGDNVIIINAEKIVLTGKKLTNKIYRKHTMHPGGLKERTAGLMVEKYPEELLELSIKGMLPKNSFEELKEWNYMYIVEKIIHIQHKNQKNMNYVDN